MEPVIVHDAFGQTLAICPEFLKYLSLKEPHLLWMQKLDFFVCNFRKRPPTMADIERALKIDGVWTRIDLHENLENEVIGFNTLFLGCASRMIPRLFESIKENHVSLQHFIAATDVLCAKQDSAYGFHGTLDHFLAEEEVAELPLSVIDLDKNIIMPLTRELFVVCGGVLLM